MLALAVGHAHGYVEWAEPFSAKCDGRASAVAPAYRFSPAAGGRNLARVSYQSRLRAYSNFSRLETGAVHVRICLLCTKHVSYSVYSGTTGFQ